ncbi:MAG: hypothetical protein AB1798_14370, partial [Spirochaetota bacterium]
DSVTKEKAEKLIDLLELYPEKMGYHLDYGIELQSAGISIRLIPGNHSVPCSMVRLAEEHVIVLYTSDTAYNPELKKKTGECNVLIHEATSAHSGITELAPDGHSSAYQAGLAAKAADAQKLFLCHLCNNRYPAADSALSEAKKAYPGEVIMPELFKWYDL